MTLNVTPGTGAALKTNLDGGEHVPVHSEDATQRTALLAALAALDPDVGLAAIVTALQATLAVSAASLPLPTGAATQTTLAAVLAKIIAAPATEAKQDAVIGHVDGIEAALAGTLSVRDADAGEYETVGASQTEQILGATGAANDFLAGLLVIPATTSPGAITIKDGSGSAITVFTGGASSVSNLVPFFIPLSLRAGTNWKVTTGANVSVIASGNFS